MKVRVQGGTIWLFQKNMGQLFDTSSDNISLHLKNIFAEEELLADSVTEEFSVTAADGKNYRVNSKRATAFRQWATGVLRDFTLRGYVMDRKRMENGVFLDDDYFERLLEEIREIRLSERRFYQKITDICSTAMDYDKDSLITREFFAKVQNKMHFAVHGHTAAELIYKRADASKEHMGLTNWANSPKGKIVKSELIFFFLLRSEECPMIYAYEDSNPDYKELLKVGYTAIDVKQRVAQQYPTKRPDGKIPYRIVFKESAIYPYGGNFNDQNVHRALIKKGFPSVGDENFLFVIYFAFQNHYLVIYIFSGSSGRMV